MKYKVGDKIRIREDSKYSWQIKQTDGNEGEIIKIIEAPHPYIIIFKNGYENAYDSMDLELIKIINWRKQFKKDKKVFYINAPELVNLQREGSIVLKDDKNKSEILLLFDEVKP